MMEFKYRFIAVLAFVTIQSILFACASNAPTVTGKADVEAWELKFAGQTVGTMKMTLNCIRIEKDMYSITGKLSGRIKDHRAGMGKADFKLKGKINKGLFKASIGGFCDMTEGLSIANGGMRGKVAESQGSGTWRVAHALGSSTGTYTMKKIESSQ